MISISVVSGQILESRKKIKLDDKRLDKVAKGTFYDGFIKLTSGKTIEGELFYDPTSTIVYKKEGKTTIPYIIGQVAYFKIGTRTFYSIPFDVFESGKKAPVFFEILFEKNNLAVLHNYSDIFAPQLKQPSGVNNSRGDSGKRESSMIYIVNGSNGIEPFMYSGDKGNMTQDILKPISLSNISLKGKKSRMMPDFASSHHLVDKKLLENFLGDKYEAVMTFAKGEKLNVRYLRDLIKIMDYYASIKSD